MSTPTKIEVNGTTYIIGRLDAFKQLHVARKIAPIITTLGATALKMSSPTAASEGDMGMALMAPAMEVVSRMEEVDVNYVVQTCLGVVMRLSGDDQRPAKVMQGSNLMFQDIDLTLMIRLTVEVVRENLSAFFPLLNGDTTSQANSGGQ